MTLLRRFLKALLSGSSINLPPYYSQLMQSPHFENLITRGDLRYTHPAVREVLQDDAMKFAQKLPKTLFVFEPPIDLIEEKQNFTIHADIPGFHKNNISITVTDEEKGELVIKGDLVDLEEKQKREEEEVFGTYLIQERALMPEFERKIILQNPADIDWEKIKANIKHGKLTVTIPKREQPEKPPKESKVIPIHEEQ
ncbi:hypothetical protein FDP41_011333 [Naegleria fowleri]|uniref:SHSP domain-containing protein n=1 Tax=Naegleria fowleri TaxID=5763 RepID=A0A6A5BWD9_NAEFO|nr:uncharacterized protein FDP41_011333 [Naegleria fowleri]KAF0982403.1 hypothetical protein FDP41_011333 [Naegleria fowleri]CAG4719141.1 unnamed protein product [Naegleria fowleri]